MPSFLKYTLIVCYRLRNVYSDSAYFKNQVVLLLLSCFFLKYLGNGQCHL